MKIINFDKVSLAGRVGIQQRQKIKGIGTVEHRARYKYGGIKKHNEEQKPYKKDRPDSVIRPFAGYVHDAMNFKNRKWDDEALLKEAGYSESVWLENFPD